MAVGCGTACDPAGILHDQWTPSLQHYFSVAVWLLADGLLQVGHYRVPRSLLTEGRSCELLVPSLVYSPRFVPLQGLSLLFLWVQYDSPTRAP